MCPLIASFTLRCYRGNLWLPHNFHPARNCSSEQSKHATYESLGEIFSLISLQLFSLFLLMLYIEAIRCYQFKLSWLSFGQLLSCPFLIFKGTMTVWLGLLLWQAPQFKFRLVEDRVGEKYVTLPRSNI